jgi:metallophosphoesterase superfamily enzyme
VGQAGVVHCTQHPQVTGVKAGVLGHQHPARGMFGGVGT